MEGRQFGVGMAAGLLVALSIVALSGFAALPAAAPVSSTPGSKLTSTSTAVASTPGSQGADFGASTTGTAQAPPSASSSTGSANATTAGSNVERPSVFSSSLTSIGQLSSLSRALVLAPIVVAVLLGALLYRVSGRPQREPNQP